MLAVTLGLLTLGARADPLFDEPIAPTGACLGWFKNTISGQPQNCARTCAYAFKKYHNKFEKCAHHHNLKLVPARPEHERLIKTSPKPFNIQNNVCKVLHRGVQQSSTGQSHPYKYEFYGNNLANYGGFDKRCYPWNNFKTFKCLCVVGPKMKMIPVPAIPSRPSIVGSMANAGGKRRPKAAAGKEALEGKPSGCPKIGNKETIEDVLGASQ